MIASCHREGRQRLRFLAEAEKIGQKHLLTLEPGISGPQTSQMEASSLQHMVPFSVQESYSNAQRGWLLSVGDFIGEEKARAVS
ncbi:MAG: type II restriction endonuclease [Pseudomonadota bacterium]